MGAKAAAGSGVQRLHRLGRTDRRAQLTCPGSVLRYARRRSEPLVVTDATSDDRFAGDPYFADVDRCSLVAIPILSGGRLRAMLLLENRLIRGHSPLSALTPST